MKNATRRRGKSRLIPVVLVLILAAGSLGGWMVLRNDTKGVDTATTVTAETVEAIEGTVSVRVDATAVAEPYDLRTVRATTGGTIVALAAEGQPVAAGQPLVQFDPTGLDRQVALARIALQESELTRERSAETLERAGDLLQEREQLLASGAVAREQVIAAGDQVTSAEFAFRSADLSVEKARLALETAIQARSEATVRAPFDGTVLSVSAAVGDWAGQNAVILTFGDLSRLRFRAEVDEYDIARIEVGLSVAIRSDSLGERSLQATVESISPEATIVNNISVFRVTAASGNAGGALKPGMSADLLIQIAEDSGIVVPARAVSTVRARSYVDVVTGDEVETRRIEIGANDGASVVVLSGLEVGELVKMPERSGVLPTATAAPPTNDGGTSIIPMSVPGGGGGGGGGGTR